MVIGSGLVPAETSIVLSGAEPINAVDLVHEGHKLALELGDTLAINNRREGESLEAGVTFGYLSLPFPHGP